MEEKKKKERKLTPREVKRAEKVQVLVDELEAQGFEKRDLTISVVRANVMAFVLCLPIVIVFFILFILSVDEMPKMFSLGSYLVWLAAIVVSVVVHEAIHGFFWGLSAKNHFASVEFGFIKEYLTPYCSCVEPLSKGQYILGGVMPGVLLGIVPMVISLMTGSMGLYLYGAVMTLAAGGDATILLKMLMFREKHKEIVYLDHPYECGLMAFVR